MAARTLTVPVRARIPASTRIRLKLARGFVRLSSPRLAQATVGRLAYDIKVGDARWRRYHLDVNVTELRR